MIAGVFAIFPVPVAQTFGSKYGASVYPLVLLGSPLSALLVTFQTKVLYPYFGSLAVIYVGTACSIVAILVAKWFDQDLDIQSMSFGRLRCPAVVELQPPQHTRRRRFELFLGHSVIMYLLLHIANKCTVEVFSLSPLPLLLIE